MYTMQMIYMHGDTPCTVIDVDFLEKKVRIEKFTDDMIYRAFGVIEAPSWEDLDYFLKSRCFPETRYNCKELLSSLGIDSYDPVQIIEKTKGRCYDDNMWVDIKYTE